MVGRIGVAGCLSARERANGVYGEDAGGEGGELRGPWRSGWLSGLAIDWDERAHRVEEEEVQRVKRKGIS